MSLHSILYSYTVKVMLSWDAAHQVLALAKKYLVMRGGVEQMIYIGLSHVAMKFGPLFWYKYKRKFVCFIR